MIMNQNEFATYQEFSVVSVMLNSRPSPFELNKWIQKWDQAVEIATTEEHASREALHFRLCSLFIDEENALERYYSVISDVANELITQFKIPFLNGK